MAQRVALHINAKKYYFSTVWMRIEPFLESSL